MKSNMSVNVEFLAGTSLEDAIKEAREKAIEWNVSYICFNYNGVKIDIGSYAAVDEVVNDYHKALVSSSLKYVCCN